MSKEKLYFRDEDDTTCRPLNWHLDDARDEELSEVTLIEAVPDNDNPDYIFCGYYGEVGERSLCTKNNCPAYTSKSGRGVCEHRGKLFEYGNKVTFKVE